jgi:hypothetical protein
VERLLSNRRNRTKDRVVRPVQPLVSASGESSAVADAATGLLDTDRETVVEASHADSEVDADRASEAGRDPDPDEASETDTLRSGSIWAVLVLGVVSLSGIIFWIVAEARFGSGGRVVEGDVVSQASAWYTLVQAGVVASALGGPIMVNRSGGGADARRTAGATLTVLTAASLLVGLVAPLAAKAEWRSVGGLGGVELALATAFFVVGSALSLLVDARLMSMRLWRWFFVRATVPAVLRVLLLFLDPWDDRAAWILVASVVPVAASGVVAAVALYFVGGFSPAWPTALTTDQRRFLFLQHLGAAVVQVPYHVVPLLVSHQVTNSTFAAFYLIWNIGVVTAAVPAMLSQVLLSETSMARAGRVKMIRATLAVNVALMVVGWLTTMVLAAPVLALVGPVHRALAPLLPSILLASLAWGITAVILTEARLVNDSVSTTVITVTILLGTVGFALLLMPGQPLRGAVNAWLAANVVATLVGMVAMEVRTARAVEL